MGAFTKRYDHISDCIITDCVVSRGSDDKPEENAASESYFALWDSGATTSIITRKVIEQLQLVPVGICQVAGIHGVEYEYTYYVNLAVSGPMNFTMLEVTEGELDDVDVLIGMDVISQGDFCISNGNDETLFSFRSPAGNPIDFEKI